MVQANTAQNETFLQICIAYLADPHVRKEKGRGVHIIEMLQSGLWRAKGPTSKRCPGGPARPAR